MGDLSGPVPTSRMVAERPPRSLRSRLPLVRGRAAEGGRGSLTHHPEVAQHAASGNWRAIETNLCRKYDGYRDPVEQRWLVLPLLDACYCGFNQQRMP